MNTDATNLLKSLASGVRTNAAASPLANATGLTGQLESGQFADLLRRAQSGELTSSRPVSIGRDAKVNLSADQLAKISLAADKAEVAGVRSALVLIDGQAVTLDVGSRTVTGKADLGSGVMAGIDGFINLSPSAVSAGSEPAALGLPSLASGRGLGASLAKLLADREGKSGQSDVAA
jgi:hypothetical protein